MLDIKDYLIGNTEPAEIKKWCVGGENPVTTMNANFNKDLFSNLQEEYINNPSLETKEELIKNRELLYNTAWNRIPSFIKLEEENIVTMWELNCYEQAVRHFNEFKIMYLKMGKKALNREIKF